MARNMARIGMGTLGLLAGLGAPRLAAQSWALPASDPVGIARSGTGVAYGASLEAASLNPALLATLREPRSAFLSAGMEMEGVQSTLQSNQQTLSNSDHNRFLPALGAAFRLDSRVVVGLKLDQPFLRHVQMPSDYTGRFQGSRLDLHTRRLEAQVGWAYTPNWAFGASLGVTRIEYSWDNMVRNVVANPSTGSALGLLESDLHQEGSRTVPSWSVGFRWAPNSRWTFAGAFVGTIRASLPLSTRYGSTASSTYALSGYGPAPAGTGGAGATLQSGASLQSGSNRIALPGKLTMGVRQRVNTLFTWEADVRYVLGASAELPGYPTMTVAGGSAVSGSGETQAFRNGFGMNLMAELDLSKRVVLRLGAELDPALRATGDVEPLTGGAKSAGFSGGIGWKVLGGEINFGYQFRQAQDTDVPSLDGKWSASGYSTNPTSTTRVEGMGHLWSLGYKRAF